MSDKIYWVALAITSGIGPRTFVALVERFGTPAMVFQASEEELTAVPRVTAETAAQIRATDIDRVENELYALTEEGVFVVTLDDADYPHNLAQLDDAPPVLFIRGALRPEDERAVAIVGTREASEHGRTIAGQLAQGFAERGFTVVSGLARGIDTAAHLGALEAQGRTLAVLGSGIRVIHPRENTLLAEKVANGYGAVLSEFHPNTPPRGTTLMTRNRLISGLARGVIVVEAAPGSGSLDTAKRAQKQKRQVFAVQGGGAGVDDLLRAGTQAIDPTAINWDMLTNALDARRADNKDVSGGQMTLL